MRWRKSSRSGNGGESCVELGTEGGRHPFAVRDSKNPTGPSLTLNLGVFLAAVKTGVLDMP